LSIRVYALSKEVGVTSKVLLQYCRLEGIDVKSHASTLTESEAKRLRVRVEAEAQAEQTEAAEAPAETVSAPAAKLPLRTKTGKLAFAPKRGAIRRRPATRGIMAPSETEKAETEAPEAKTAAPEAPAEALEVEGPPGGVEAAPLAEEIAAAEAPEEQKKPKPVSIDEFVIEVPKAIGRIEGIVPKEIPPRARDRKKGKEEEKEKKTKMPAKAHPQAIGLLPDKQAVLGEAGRKAREVASRTIKEKQAETQSQKGLVADTNRPKAGRSASAGGRRRYAKGAVAEGEGEEGKKVAKPQRRGGQVRREDKVTLDSDVNVLGSGHVRLERGEAVRRPFGERRRRQRVERTKRADEALAKGRTVEIEEPITVKSFCEAVGVRAGPVIAHLMRRGLMITVNEVMARELAEELAEEFGVELKVKAALDIEEAIQAEVQSLDSQQAERFELPRIPVVTFLGHVDHGKTSLLDHIRSTKVVEGEAGGITQHIGAYHVDFGERGVTFLDTPGHAAFTAMRARGAQVTDIVVLVVAADDGIMPQTEEAINHARAAEVPIVVALNKMDVPGANLQRVLGQLAERDLVPEQWGGKTIVVETSAITGQGIDDLLEALSLEAELLELTADRSRLARGVVVEAEMREGLGAVMNLLVRDGTLKIGDVILGGLAVGRVRAMVDDQGRSVTEAGPSMPVSVSGLSVIPDAGDGFFVFESLQKAREFAEQRHIRERRKSLASIRHVTLEDLFEQMAAQEVSELRVIIKADVQGSVEVLRHSIGEFQHPEVQIKVLHAAVGGINESDVLLADASDAVVIGFQVIADTRARGLAERKGVDIRLYSVIYRVMEDLKLALEGMLAPEQRHDVIGHLVVRQTFKVSRLGTIAGCYVTDGVIRRTNGIRVSRQGVVVHEGDLDSLKRFKDDAREVPTGIECGLKIAGFDDIKVDDVIEAIEVVEVKRTL